MESQEVNAETTIGGGPRAASVLPAHIALLMANMCWGFMSPVSKSVLLSGTLSPLALSAVRIGAAAIIFLLVTPLLPSAVAPRERIARSDWSKILIASLLMISANQGLYILGVGYTNPVDASVMSSLTPMITMVLAAIVLRFPITRLKFTGVAIGLTGVIILVTNQAADTALASNPLLGDSLCLAAQICAAFYYVMFSGLIQRYSPVTLMKWMFLLSAITYVPFCIPELLKVDYAALPSGVWFGIAYIVLFGTAFSYLTLPFAQRCLRPTVVSIYNYVQPVCAALMALILGVGDFGPVKIAATALIFAGVWFVSRNSPGRSA